MANPTPVSRAEAQAAIDAFDWDGWRADLVDQYGGWYRGAVNDAGRKSARARDADWRPDDPFVTEFASRYVAERVTQITGTTRERLRTRINQQFDALTDGEGLSVTELGATIHELFDDFSRARAQDIARTETAYALNHGDLFAQVAAGCRYVLVSDGDFDEVCAAADGQVWSIDYALANALAHPNCERSFTPISDEDALAAGIDQE